MRFDLCLCGPRRAAERPPLLALDAGPSPSDPTGTARIVAQFTQDMDRRWRGMRSAMLAAAVKFADPKSTHGSDQVRAFQTWLDETLRTLVVGGTGIWMLKYLQQSEALATSRGKQLVGNVEPQSRIQTLLTMASSELQGICDAVSQQATRAFASGLMSNKVNRKDVADVALNVGRMRGRLLTQFFTVRTFGAATLDTFRAAGVTHVGTRPEAKPARLTTDAKSKRKKPSGKALNKIFRAERKIQALGEVDVLTAGDDKVCPICEDISENGPYDIDHAESLIPAHNRCRCAFVPANDARFAHDGVAVIICGRVAVSDGFNPDQPRDKDGKWSSGSGDEARSVMRYQEDDPYTNGVALNMALRDGEKLDPDMKKMRDALDKAIANAPPTTKPMTLWRGTDDDYHTGKGDPAFFSATADRKVANDIASEGGESGTVYKITVPAGTKMLDMKRYFAANKQHAEKSSTSADISQFEKQFVLPRNAKFERRGKSGNVVELTYKPPTRKSVRDDFNPNQPRDKYGKWTEGGSTGGSAKAKEFAETLKNADVPNVTEFHDPNAGVHGVTISNQYPESFKLAASMHGVSEHQIEEKNGTLTALFPPDKKLSASAPKEIDFADLTKVGEQKGSNEGGVYKDSEGNEYYVKKPKTKDHVTNELIAAALYKLAGVNTLDYVPVKGGEYVATRLKPLDVDNVSKLTPEQRTQAQSDFAIHAWLANWDAVGTGGDNVGVVDGRVTTLDTGGSLAYRAQGKPKGAAFDDEVGEIDTLRDPSKNPDAAKLYGNMTNDQIVQSMDRVIAIKSTDIKNAVLSNGGTIEIANKLIARTGDIIGQREKMLKAAASATPQVAAQTTDHPALALKKFVAGTSAERVTMRKHLTTIPSYSDDAKTTKLKIIASFWKQHDALTKKNSPKTAELASKLAQYAAKYKISNPLTAPKVVATPTTGASTPAPPPKTTFFKPPPTPEPTVDLSSMSEEQVRQHMLNKVTKGKSSSWVNSGATAIKHNPELKGYGLTPSEIGYIKAFTGPYSGLNEELRDGHMSEEVFYFKHIMNNALDKFPVYSGDTVWRKIKLNDSTRAKYGKVGSVVHWSAFSSTAKNPNVWSGNTQFVIHKPKTGRDVQSISSHSSEAEVIMPADTYYKVLKAPEYKTCEDGVQRWVIELEEVVPFGKKKTA